MRYEEKIGTHREGGKDREESVRAVVSGSEHQKVMTRVPSYKGLQPASPLASHVKSRNRKTDTEHEVLLRRELWRLGLRFRKNVQRLPGKPDIVFPGARVAVFCDGDFWHGRRWPAQREKLERGTNPGYWVAKIESNLERDARNTAVLEADGWCVIRLWETDVKQDPHAAAQVVAQIVRTRHNRSNPTRRSFPTSEQI